MKSIENMQTYLFHLHLRGLMKRKGRQFPSMVKERREGEGSGRMVEMLERRRVGDCVFGDGR